MEIRLANQAAPQGLLRCLAQRKVRLPAGLDERQVTGIERAIRSCPAYGTLLHPPSLQVVLDAGPDLAREAQSA